ncbi:hypothetical protein MKX01_009339 [Papaver californicum]|nr:hypothetical protein MKX01_009339 [Papaver californicum]
MAVSGFEGFEKRLELKFSGHDDPKMIGMGLRRIDFDSIQQVLDAVQCTVVSAVGNRHFDAYVLSESSLFVYPTKIIIKTCGTTQLLKSVPIMLSHASDIGLNICSCRYTRGSFIFPKAQPFPHTSFRDEVEYLDQSLPHELCYRKASVMPSKKTKKSLHSWHVYSASDHTDHDIEDINFDHEDGIFTIEVCMTELDQVLSRKFFRSFGDSGTPGEVAGKEMTKLTGINKINPNALICDFAFDPCGYSMNGLDSSCYSTIHVTPEDGFSYASFECVGFIDDYNKSIQEILKRVVQIFRPGVMSVSTTSSSPSQCMSRCVTNAVETLGMKRRSCTVDEFPAAGIVVFQTFTTTGRKRLV